jgi:hypothetical protein
MNRRRENAFGNIRLHRLMACQGPSRQRSPLMRHPSPGNIVQPAPTNQLVPGWRGPVALQGRVLNSPHASHDGPQQYLVKIGGIFRLNDAGSFS